jgi:hypothetical protein
MLLSGMEQYLLGKKITAWPKFLKPKSMSPHARSRKLSFSSYGRSCLSAMLIFNTILAKTSFAQSCLSHADLLELESADLASAMPCDALGFSYLIGLGFTQKKYRGELRSENHQYYSFFRYSLELKRREGEKSTNDAIAFLIAAAQSLALEDEVAMGRRYYAYQAYIVGEFWKANASEILDSREVIDETFTALLSLSGFTNYHSLVCFIEIDLPSLDIEEITDSARYKVCSKPE